MAAFDVPWVDPMSSSTRDISDAVPSQADGTAQPPTYAAFSPANLGHATMASQRTTILVHQKSPLLIATPPQVTRALAYSHPFVVPLNRLAGLLTWTSGDPWESFLLVAAFWAVTLYGDAVVRWAGPVVLVAGLILSMYLRRYSSLSSTKWTGSKGSDASDDGTRHHKSLDEIVDELKLLTSRCTILMDPALRLTDFLSTQRTATTATTRPALTALFIRVLVVSPVWFVLTLPPFYVITTQRVVLAVGTVALSWHSRPARVTRTLIWRSKTIRRACAAVTGLELAEAQAGPPLPPRGRSANEAAAALAARRKPDPTGIRFTFTIYENQRRWLGIGWTGSMLAYERAPWTDEELNPTAPRDEFQLPEVEGGVARWRWVKGSSWRVDGTGSGGGGGGGGDDDEDRGWIYYDNKWRNGRRDKDGWGRYTRRRKWCRDAELIESTEADATSGVSSAEMTPSASTPRVEAEASDAATLADDAASLAGTANNGGSTPAAKKRRWFRRSSGAGSVSTIGASSGGSGGSGSGGGRREDDREQDVHSPLHHTERDSDWGLGDDARMNLG